MISRSAMNRNAAKMTLVTRTTIVVPTTSSRVGKLTFRISVRTSDRNSFVLVHQFILGPRSSIHQKRLAGQEGLEPPTLGFGDRCSTIMSYWPVRLLLCQRAGAGTKPLPPTPTKAYSLF